MFSSYRISKVSVKLKMKITIMHILLTLIVILVIYYLWSNLRQAADSVNYKVTFSSQWGADENINHPENPHTGNMFLVTHNEKFNLFKEGTLASKGISNTSMLGTLDDLIALVKNDPNVGEVVTAKVLTTPGNQSMSINANPKFNYLSFVTMVAPSPDWFTGLSGVNLIQGGQWITDMSLPLYVYDAGTDSGTGFNKDHVSEKVPKAIQKKTDSFLYPSGNVTPIGSLRISRA